MSDASPISSHHRAVRTTTMSDWLADYLDWMADHPELSTPPDDDTDGAVRTTTMATYCVYGTAKASPSDDDWELLVETSDAVQATEMVHESEGTFWRRLTEDGHVVLDRV